MPSAEDGLEAQDIVAHGAVADRSAARGAGGGHAAQGGVGTGIDWKVQAGILCPEVFVELLAGDAGFDCGIHVGGTDAEDAVHAREIDAQAAAHGDDAAFDGRTGAKGHDWHLVRGADPGDLGYFFNAGGEGYGLRRLRGVIGGVGGVGAAHFRGLIQTRGRGEWLAPTGLGGSMGFMGRYYVQRLEGRQN